MRHHMYRRALFHISRDELSRRIAAWLIKGGFITYLPDEFLPMTRYGLVDHPGIDWGYLRKGKELVTRERARRGWYKFECGGPDCRRHINVQGKDEVKAFYQAWKKGWSFTDDITLCPWCKPGVADGNYKPGMRVVHREFGTEYRVMAYKPRGDHVLNIGFWPELWCEDLYGHEHVFIFWENRPPEGLTAV